LSTKVSSKQNTIQGMIGLKSVPWLVKETYVSKLSISSYRNIVCKNIACDIGLKSWLCYDKNADKND